MRRGSGTRRERQCRRVGALARRYAARFGATVSRADALYVCSGLPRWAFPRGGITLGDTYLTGRDPGTLAPDRLAHEDRHREQWLRHGYRMALLYPLAGRNPATNRFEVEAGLEDGGYAAPPAATRERPAGTPPGDAPSG